MRAPLSCQCISLLADSRPGRGVVLRSVHRAVHRNPQSWRASTRRCGEYQKIQFCLHGRNAERLDQEAWQTSPISYVDNENLFIKHQLSAGRHHWSRGRSLWCDNLVAILQFNWWPAISLPWKVVQHVAPTTITVNRNLCLCVRWVR